MPRLPSSPPSPPAPPTPTAETLVSLSVNLGGGVTRTLVLLEGQTPQHAATAFAEAHGLGGEDVLRQLESLLLSNFRVSVPVGDDGRRSIEYTADRVPEEVASDFCEDDSSFSGCVSSISASIRGHPQLSSITLQMTQTVLNTQLRHTAHMNHTIHACRLI